MMVMVGNWDLKTTNNPVYEISGEAAGPYRGTLSAIWAPPSAAPAGSSRARRTMSRTSSTSAS